MLEYCVPPHINYLFIVFPKTVLFEGVRSTMKVYLRSGISYNKHKLPLLLSSNLPVPSRGKHKTPTDSHTNANASFSDTQQPRECEQDARVEIGKRTHGSYKYWIKVRCNSAPYVIIATIIVRDAITMLFVRAIFCSVSISFRLKFPFGRESNCVRVEIFTPSWLFEQNN